MNIKEIITLVSIFFVFAVCWFTLNEIIECNKKIDILAEKIEKNKAHLDSTLIAGIQGLVKDVRTTQVQTRSKSNSEIITKNNVVKTPNNSTKNGQNTQPKADNNIKTHISQPQPATTAHKKIVNPKDIVITQFRKEWIDTYEYITFKNNTNEHVQKIKGTIIYKTMNGTDITYKEIDLNIGIAPGLSKQVKISSFDRDQKFQYYQNAVSYSNATKFTFEFKLTSYN